jgi:hypothetical protein
MIFTSVEQAAVDAHAAQLGISSDEYIHHSAAARALAWQRECDAFREEAARRGTTIEALLRRGCLTEDAPQDDL